MAPVIGVAGAGTMGSGIAQLACLAGSRTLLHDPVPEALQRGVEMLRDNLADGAQRGRWSPEEAVAAAARAQAAPALEDLAPCALVIEAAPESLELKRDLFARLSAIVGEDCVLATNTSSLAVTELATAASHPERVVGMHFFNPAPLTALLEVVAGELSSAEAMALARGTGEAMGKHVIVPPDRPGFLVNRCVRPFGQEALRLLEEGVATVEQIDRSCRLGGRFRMGPFELMDLVGVDVGFEVAKSFYAQSFGEPRWRPSALAGRMAAAGRHGRKAGRGWYDYSGEDHRPRDPDPPAAGGGHGTVAISGGSAIATELHDLAGAAGWEVAAEAGEEVFLVLDCEPDLGARTEEAGPPTAVLCAGRPLSALDLSGSAVAFHAIPPLAAAGLVEATRGPESSPLAFAHLEHFFETLGKNVEWVGDAPGLVLGRIVAQLVNEAAFALRDGVGDAAAVDSAMELALHHPRGPLAWADAIGLDHVLAVLDGLWAEQHDERYRACPLLREKLRRGQRFHEPAEADLHTAPE